MASSLNLIKSGKVGGKTGVAKKVVLGFKPKHVMLFNAAAGGLITAQKYAEMPTTYATKVVAAGTQTFAANMCTLESDGFTIGTDGDLNVTGEDIYYTAFEGKNE